MTNVDVEVPEAAIPGQHGVYVVFDANSDVLYIGRTQNLMNRMQSHRNSASWFRRMRTIEFTPCDGPNEARVLEKSLISEFRPDSNINDRCPQQTSKRQRLPAWTVAKLVALHEDCMVNSHRDEVANENLNNYLLALRQAGWTLAAIGEGLTMTREGVRLRVARATRADTSPGIPPAPRRAQGYQRKPAKPSIPDSALVEMRALQAEARLVRGPTPLDSPRRAASVRFSELLAEYYLAGVSIYRMSKQLGVTHLAIRARLARHGYMEPVKGLPTNTPYGTPHWKLSLAETCQAGHPLSGENLRLVKGDPNRRVCRTCERRRSDEYRARKAQERAA